MPQPREVKPNIFPDGVTLCFAGFGDSASARWAGDICNLSKTGEGVATFEWQWKDWNMIPAGQVMFEGAKLGDYIQYAIYAPATPTPPTTGGTLNCKRTDLGGGAMRIEPASGGAATHYLDLADGTKWIPIPAQKALLNRSERERAPDGHWEWNNASGYVSDYPDEGLGALIAKANQDGWFALYEFQVALAIFVKIPLLGSGILPLVISHLRPQIILPHWKHKVTLHHGAAASHTVDVAWFLAAARMKTT
ncbi:MAG: hypothetical protein A2Y38_13855 [Spirochaetes bacterium GWB1_59_5]|nr:MAG: hypothetical protein A2Y38_13855 [Spirochaetes bacterium GWB1_59_5]